MESCKHEKSMRVGFYLICEDCFLVLGEKHGRRVYPPNSSDFSRCNTPPPKGKVVDNVLGGYADSLPDNYRREFLEEFWKNNKRGQPRKKKMIIGKYVVACRHGLGFDLGDKVRKLGGDVRISAKDLL